MAVRRYRFRLAGPSPDFLRTRCPGSPQVVGSSSAAWVDVEVDEAFAADVESMAGEAGWVLEAASVLNAADSMRACGVLVGAGAQAVGSGATAVLALGTASVNRGGVSDAANSRFVVPAAGAYQVRAAVSFSFGLSTGKLVLAARRNGTEIARTTVGGIVSSETTATLATVETFAAGDVVDFTISHGVVGSVSTATGAAAPRASIERLA